MYATPPLHPKQHVPFQRRYYPSPKKSGGELLQDCTPVLAHFAAMEPDALRDVLMEAQSVEELRGVLLGAKSQIGGLEDISDLCIPGLYTAHPDGTGVLFPVGDLKAFLARWYPDASSIFLRLLHCPTATAGGGLSFTQSCATDVAFALHSPVPTRASSVVQMVRVKCSV